MDNPRNRKPAARSTSRTTRRNGRDTTRPEPDARPRRSDKSAADAAPARRARRQSAPGRRVKPAGGPESLEAALSRHIGERKYKMWFSQTKVSIDADQVALSTSSRFVADWINTHFERELSDAARETLGKKVRVEIRVAPELFDPGEAPPALRPQRGRDTDDHGDLLRDAPRPSHTTPRDRHVAPRSNRRRTPKKPVLHRLSDFVLGTSNKLAHTAAMQLADPLAKHVASPVFIHGRCGLGKTHLLQAICQRWIEQTRQPSRALYITGEQFTNEYIAAVRDNTLDAFRARYRRLELLVVDDVHFLANKMRTQSEFLHTFDALNMAGGRVALAANEHPRQMRRYSAALISRMSSGMVAELERPDRATRTEIIQRAAVQRGIKINEPATDLIAERCVGSVREILGAVTKLTALQAYDQVDSTPETVPDPDSAGGTATATARSTIGLVITERLFREQGWQPPAPIRISAIIDSVCQRLGITADDLLGSGRHRKVVLGRALVAYLSRELTTLSFPEIARALGRTYHSTVHTADQRLRRQMDADETAELTQGEPPIEIKELVDQLRHEIVRPGG